MNYGSSYRKFVSGILSRKDAAQNPNDEAMAEAIGGRFDDFGQLMCKILVQAGLMPEHYLIDIGCGSGRLTKPIAPYLTGRYLGTDVVQELLDNAKKYGKPGWRFEQVSDIAIPEKENCADMVCFFQF